MTRTEVPWSQVLSIWWAVVWRIVLVGNGATYVLVLVIGLAGLLTEPLVGTLVAIAAVIWPLAVSVWALWFAIAKEYRGFRIVIAPR